MLKKGDISPIQRPPEYLENLTTSSLTSLLQSRRLSPYRRQARLRRFACVARQASPAERVPRTRFTIDLVGGAIGVSANQRQAVELAAKHGFESVGADPGFLAGLSADQLVEFKAFMAEKGIVFGAAGLPVEFRQDEMKFQDGLKALPRAAAGLQKAGVDRVSTWLSPCSDRLTYLQNFRQHTIRLREVASILKDHGQRLGLEYVGPKTSWTRCRYPFIHSMAEMKDLIAEIGTGNVGFLLDSWHWYNAGETVADILTLEAKDVVAVDLNDAPGGIPREQQVDSRRELPCAPGHRPSRVSQSPCGNRYDVRFVPTFNQKLRHGQ